MKRGMGKRRCCGSAGLLLLFFGAALFGADGPRGTETGGGPPRRIVTAGKSVFITADALYLFPEAAERMVGIGVINQGFGNFLPLADPRYADKAVLADNVGPEQIAALRPDAVVLKSSATVLGRALEPLGIPAVYIDFETPESYPADLAVLGKLFGNSARAEELAAYFARKAGGVTSRTMSLAPGQKPRVLVVYSSDQGGSRSFRVPPADWMQTILVEMAGGVPVWKDASGVRGWNRVGFEQIAAWDPDFILVVSYSEDTRETTARLKEDRSWRRLKAVRDNRLLAFAGDYYTWDQPDPRWVLGLRWLAGRLHPGLFPPFDAAGETVEFFNFLYRIPEAVVRSEILTRLQGDLP